MLEEYDILTGEKKTDGYSSPLRAMCLNCEFCKNENGTGYCVNEKVLEIGKKKILAAVPDGYEIDTLTLKPLLLKDPTKKCSNHIPDEERIINTVASHFGMDGVFNAYKENKK